MEPDRNNSPAANPEVGSLTQRSPQESNFIGSSSGIYFFVNIVKSAFTASTQISYSLPDEATFGGDDDYWDLPSQRAPDGSRPEIQIHIESQSIRLSGTHGLGSLPPYETAQALVVGFFRHWHPLLPFLWGPTFLRNLEDLYRSLDEERTPNPDTERERICHLVILQCVFTLGRPSRSARPSPRLDMLAFVGKMASKHDLLSIQAVLAAELYCMSTMNLRTASTISGILSKLLLHAGLHRCPCRYPQLSDDSADLRKRIFWSAYVLDQNLSQALGLPPTLSDSDVDVCIPGRVERHRTRHAIVGSTDIHDDVGSHTDHAGERNGFSQSSIGNREDRVVVLSTFVDYASLLSRALEIFHKSIHVRSVDDRSVMFLRSHVERWCNNFSKSEVLSPFLPFFHVLYEQLIISTYRPSLSLPRDQPEFHHSLQITIRAARTTISLLENEEDLFWPGYLASVWMSGLIISFACQVGAYHFISASQEITRCLSLLTKLAGRWHGASRCHAVLSMLVSDLHRSGSSQLSPCSLSAQRQPPQKSDASSWASSELHISDTTDHAQSRGTKRSIELEPLESNKSQRVDYHTTQDDQMSQLDWDGSDFFQDLSWDSLFDMSE